MMYHHNRLIQGFRTDGIPKTVLKSGYIALAETSKAGVLPHSKKEGYEASVELQAIYSLMIKALAAFAKTNAHRKPVKANNSALRWAFCDNCTKWRTITVELDESLKQDQQRRFVCADNKGTTHYDSCEDPNEAHDPLTEPVTWESDSIANTAGFDLAASSEILVPDISAPPAALLLQEQPISPADIEYLDTEQQAVSGASAVVRKAMLKSTNALVAVKLFKEVGELEDLIELAFAEKNTQRMVRDNQCVVQVIGWMEQPRLALVLQWVPNGTLYSHLFPASKAPCTLNMSQRLSIAKDVASGLAALHFHGVAHLDMKPQNILLDEHLRAKITDFGLAALVEKLATKTVRSGGFGGTELYKAPEAAKGGKGIDGRKADIYSFGLLLLEIASVQKVTECWKQAGVGLFDIGDARAKGQKPSLSSAPESWRGLIDRSLALNPNDRPTIQDVHQYLLRLSADDFELPKALYRLLRPDEDPAIGLFPHDRSKLSETPSQRDMAAHVNCGSRSASSPVISLSEDRDWVLWLWCKSVIDKHNDDASTARIVAINPRLINRDGRLHCVSSPDAASAVLQAGPRVENLAVSAKEWVFWGHIPSQAIRDIWTPSSCNEGVELLHKSRKLIEQDTTGNVKLKPFDEWSKDIRRNKPSGWTGEIYAKTNTTASLHVSRLRNAPVSSSLSGNSSGASGSSGSSGASTSDGIPAQSANIVPRMQYTSEPVSSSQVAPMELSRFVLAFGSRIVYVGALS
jgi:serine/threonine protein kinase